MNKKTFLGTISPGTMFYWNAWDAHAAINPALLISVIHEVSDYGTDIVYVWTLSKNGLFKMKQSSDYTVWTVS